MSKDIFMGFAMPCFDFVLLEKKYTWPNLLKLDVYNVQYALKCLALNSFPNPSVVNL